MHHVGALPRRGGEDNYRLARLRYRRRTRASPLVTRSPGRGIFTWRKGEGMEARVVEEVRVPPGPASRALAGPGLLDRMAWRDATLAWFGQRLLCVPLAYLGL